MNRKEFLKIFPILGLGVLTPKSLVRKPKKIKEEHSVDWVKPRDLPITHAKLFCGDVELRSIKLSKPIYLYPYDKFQLDWRLDIK